MLYKDKFRIPSTRLKNWDYSSAGYYYITICVKNREHYFGDVKNHEIVLSDFGHFADRCWREIPEHFSFVSLDEYIIMPNHIHGIIEIAGKAQAETQNIASLRGGRFGSQSQNLGSIIRGFKIGVTKYAVSKDLPFAWQPRFYDHVIRNEEDLCRIQNYILSNPANWDKDEENKNVNA